MVWPAVFHRRDKKQPIFPGALSRILTICCTLGFLIDIYIPNKCLALKKEAASFLFQMLVCTLK